MSQFESVLTPQQQQQFVTGIHHIFTSWTAVQLAIDNSLLGSQRETQEAFDEIEQNIIKWVAADGDELYVKEIVNYLDDVFDEDLGLLVQDGSISEVSDQFLALFKACKNNDFSLVEQYAAISAANRSSSSRSSGVLNAVASDDEEFEDEEETTSNEPEVDEDGFTVVKSKKR